METLIICRVLRRMIWVCAVSLCPTKRTLSLLGLMYALMSIQPRMNENSGLKWENDDWIKNVLQPFRSVRISYLSTETHVLGTQNKHLNETVLLS